MSAIRFRSRGYRRYRIIPTELKRQVPSHRHAEQRPMAAEHTTARSGEPHSKIHPRYSTIPSSTRRCVSSHRYCRRLLSISSSVSKDLLRTYITRAALAEVQHRRTSAVTMTYEHLAMIPFMIDASHLTPEEAAERAANPALWAARRYRMPEHIFQAAGRFSRRQNDTAN